MSLQNQDDENKNNPIFFKPVYSDHYKLLYLFYKSSRMDSDHKDRSKSRNKEKKDKDKKKKKKHDDRERSKSHKKKKHSQKQRQYDDGYEKERQRQHKSTKNRDRSIDIQREKYREKDILREDKEREYMREREKQKQKDRQRERDKDKQRERQRQRQREKDRERQKHRDKDRQRQRGKEKDREKDRDRGKEKQRERDRDRDREAEKQREKDRQRQKDRQKQKQKQRAKIKDMEKQKQKQRQKNQRMDEQGEKQVERQRMIDQRSAERTNKKKKRKSSSHEKKKSKKEKKQKGDSYHNQRSRSRDKKKKKKSGFDRHRSKRQEKSSDSSSSDSGQQNFSDDPEQVQKLAQMKAAKQLVSSKADRKLYLGNLPPNITSQQLMDMLNGALKKMEINTEIEGDSIVSAWISPDGVGHYAFVEFRSAQQATNGLTLNGASLFGYQLKLGRPKQYIEYNKTLLSEMGTDRNLETILKKVAALGAEILPPIQQRIIYPPSKIIVLKYIVSIEQLAIDEQFEEILYDVKEMAKRFGQVVDIVIPRPHQIINLELAPKRVKGLGLIFIEYKDISQAKFARSQFVTKQFSGQPVACCFFDQQQFRAGQYDMQQKVIIEF